MNVFVYLIFFSFSCQCNVTNLTCEPRRHCTLCQTVNEYFFVTSFILLLAFNVLSILCTNRNLCWSRLISQVWGMSIIKKTKTFSRAFADVIVFAKCDYRNGNCYPRSQDPTTDPCSSASKCLQVDFFWDIHCLTPQLGMHAYHRTHHQNSHTRARTHRHATCTHKTETKA